MLAGRPVIGITPNHFKNPDVEGAKTPYFDSIRRAGGVPVLIPFGDDDVLDAFFELLDGLLVSGGADVDPALYGETPHPACGEPAPQRDALELRLLRRAWAEDLPVLAICRGAQIANVALGGTLWQDLAEQKGIPAERHRRPDAESSVIHEVRCVPDSRLCAIAGPCLGVNSIHHQAVKMLAAPLAASAHSLEDGIVEGWEAPGKNFFIGVQWHPERMNDAASSRLFETFVAAARESRS